MSPLLILFEEICGTFMTNTKGKGSAEEDLKMVASFLWMDRSLTEVFAPICFILWPGKGLYWKREFIFVEICRVLYKEEGILFFKAVQLFNLLRCLVCKCKSYSCFSCVRKNLLSISSTWLFYWKIKEKCIIISNNVRFRDIMSKNPKHHVNIKPMRGQINP